MTKFRMPPDYQPTPAERRVMTHILKSFSDEVVVLQEDGMAPRAIVVGLLMSAVKLAAASDALPPADFRGFVEAILEQYTSEDEK